MYSKTKYLSFCQSEPMMPVFVQPWYLDVVCQEGEWDVVLVERGGKVVAALPFYLTQKGPFQTINMPWLTKMMGPYIKDAFRQTNKSHRIVKELIDQLPKVAAFHQNFHYDITDWLPFFWKQYQQSTKYSYMLDDLENLEKVYSGFCSDYRNNKIKKAVSTVRVITDRSLEDFYRVQTMSFTRQGKNFTIPFSFLINYDKILKSKQCREIFFAVDEQGRVHSVVYLIWDQRSAYYIMAGDDPALRKSGAGILLVWEALQYTKNVLGLNCFDFQGSMIPAIEKVRRNFGATPTPYFQVWKEESRVYRFLRMLRGR